MVLVLRPAFIAGALLAATLLVGASPATLPAAAAEKLPGYNVDVKRTTVSGLSSGAFMAHQLHIAHSDVIQGAAILAGGPYYCADASLTKAMGRCTCFSKEGFDKIYNKKTVCNETFGSMSPPRAEDSLATARKHEVAKLIAPLANIKDDKVFLMIGDGDQVVLPQSMQAVNDLYLKLGVAKANIAWPKLKGNHTFPTLGQGIACGDLGSPYIGKCDVDAAGALLQHLVGPLKPKANAPSGTLVKFDQGEFAGGAPESISMADTGYAYVPKNCAAGEACRLHVALHGCGQSVEALKGTAYIEETGYLPWADSNNLIILFPQTVSTLDLLKGMINPKGCWDWFGYEDGTRLGDKNLYGTREGPQVKAIRAMIDRIGSKRA